MGRRSLQENELVGGGSEMWSQPGKQASVRYTRQRKSISKGAKLRKARMCAKKSQAALDSATRNEEGAARIGRGRI